MSSVPQHTQILIKDLDFQAKYHLSHTQVDVMAYMANVPYWADNVEGYFVIATSKVLSDLPHLGLKNFEPAFKALKDLGLIESKIVHVVEWKGKPKLRGIRLTEKGKEYHKKLILPTQDKKLKELEKEVKRLHGVDEENERLKAMIESLTLDNEAKQEKEEEEKEKVDLEKEPEPTPEPKKDELAEFIQKNIKYFGATSRPICNFVPTYQKETTFYINSYNKLSSIPKNGEAKQISNPQKVYEFWQWLYLNKARVGNRIDFSKTPTIKELKQRFINRAIKLQEIVCTISNFVESEKGIQIEVKEKNGTKRFLLNGETKKPMFFEALDCQRVVLKVLYNQIT